VGSHAEVEPGLQLGVLPLALGPEPAGGGFPLRTELGVSAKATSETNVAGLCPALE